MACLSADREKGGKEFSGFPQRNKAHKVYFSPPRLPIFPATSLFFVLSFLRGLFIPQRHKTHKEYFSLHRLPVFPATSLFFVPSFLRGLFIPLRHKEHKEYIFSVAIYRTSVLLLSVLAPSWFVYHQDTKPTKNSFSFATLPAFPSSRNFFLLCAFASSW